jgi:6-phosphogluconate dehydrogenase
MQLGMIGLGRMGANMAQRLMNAGHQVVAFDRNPCAVEELVKLGAVGAESPTDLVAKLTGPKAVWIMVPVGNPVERLLDELVPHLNEGDIVVDGGNSNFKDTMRRAEKLSRIGIHYVDSGTSGGVWGLKNGYCLMIGGPKPAVDHLAPVFDALAPPDGWAHMGESGSGHYVKMVHNGIEYALLQSYGEGFEILHNSRFDLDLHQITKLWNKGSVVRSWLLELAEQAFEHEGESLEHIAGYVEDSGMGRWTVQEAMDLSVPAPCITLSLQERFASRQKEHFSAKVIAALRNEFGGHAVKRE